MEPTGWQTQPRGCYSSSLSNTVLALRVTKCLERACWQTQLRGYYSSSLSNTVLAPRVMFGAGRLAKSAAWVLLFESKQYSARLSENLARHVFLVPREYDDDLTVGS